MPRHDFPQATKKDESLFLASCYTMVPMGQLEGFAIIQLPNPLAEKCISVEINQL